MKFQSIMRLLALFFMVLMIVSCIVPYFTYAGEYLWNDPTQFDNKSNTELDDSVRIVISSVLSVTRIIGTGLALIILVVIAMKYMTAAPGERADIKKHAIPFVIGAVVLFGATGILTIIQSFANKIGIG